MNRRRNWILFVVVVFIWGSSWSVGKVALGYVGPFNFALHRFALSTLALSPLLIYLGRRMPREKRTILRLLLLGALNASAAIVTFWGLSHETSGISAILSQTQPIFVFCLCAAFLRAEARGDRLLGALVGFSGVATISIGRSSSALASVSTGDLMLLLGAFLWAVTAVYYKRSLRHVDAVLTSVILQALGAVFLAPLLLVAEGLSLPLTLSYLSMILYLSIFASGVAMCFWLYLVREEDVTVISTSSLLIVVIAVFLGWMILSEEMRPLSLVGMGMILVGLYLTNRS